MELNSRKVNKATSGQFLSIKWPTKLTAVAVAGAVVASVAHALLKSMRIFCFDVDLNLKSDFVFAMTPAHRKSGAIVKFTNQSVCRAVMQRQINVGEKSSDSIHLAHCGLCNNFRLRCLSHFRCNFDCLLLFWLTQWFCLFCDFFSNKNKHSINSKLSFRVLCVRCKMTGNNIWNANNRALSQQKKNEVKEKEEPKPYFDFAQPIKIPVNYFAFVYFYNVLFRIHLILDFVSRRHTAEPHTMRYNHIVFFVAYV